MRPKTIGAVLLVVVGIGAAAFAVIGPSIGGTSATQYLTSQATVSDVLDQVAATGTVQAATTYTLAFGSAPSLATGASSAASSASASGGGSPWTVASVDVVAGQAITAGAVLATADASSAALDVTVAEANLASAQARLASDRAGLTATEKAAARLQVTQASQSLVQARSSYASTVAQNNLKLRQAEQAVADAREKLEADRKAGQPSAVISADADAVNRARDSLATLRLQVSQANAQAAGQVSQATLGVTSARYAYEQKTAKADAATIATDKAAVAQARQALTAAKEALRYTSLVSPVDGIVVAVDVTPGLAAPAGAAITVRSPELQVTASVAESDLPAIALGQHGTVTITALATDVAGTVARIDQAPASSTTGVVSYGIVVSLAETPTGAMPGMSAEIAITTASATDVLAVPAIALDTAADGSYTVQVLDAAGQPTTVAVEVGLVTSSLAEIKGGLDEGTAVVTGTASDRTGSGASTTTRLPGLDGGGFPGGGFPGGRP